MNDDLTRETLSQINTKLDVLISQHGILNDKVVDHEGRLRDLEVAKSTSGHAVTELGKDVADHEDRLRATDRWRYALPISALTGILSAGTALVSVWQG